MFYNLYKCHNTVLIKIMNGKLRKHIFVRPLKNVPCTISMQLTTCVKYSVFYLTMEKYKWFNNILQGKPFTTSK